MIELLFILAKFFDRHYAFQSLEEFVQYIGEETVIMLCFCFALVMGRFKLHVALGIQLHVLVTAS